MFGKPLNINTNGLFEFEIQDADGITFRCELKIHPNKGITPIMVDIGSLNPQIHRMERNGFSSGSRRHSLREDEYCSLTEE